MISDDWFTMDVTIAGIPLRVSHETLYLGVFCRKYRDDSGGERVCIELTYEDALAERVNGVQAHAGYFEALAFCRKLCRVAVDHDAMLFHASAIAVDGKAYLFAAPSGTGKSTHTALWRELLGDRAVMINDDKPFLRREDGVWYAYGSPWHGKHRLSSPIRVPIGAICLLSQGERNEIEPISPSDAFPGLFAQTQRLTDEAGMTRQMELLSDLAEHTALYRLRCTPSMDAARLSYTTLLGETI